MSSLSSSTANDGSFGWSIPSNLEESNYYQIRIYSTADSDINDLSDGYFENTVGEDTTFYLNENWEGGDYSGWLGSGLSSSNWVITDTVIKEIGVQCQEVSQLVVNTPIFIKKLIHLVMDIFG